MRTVQSLACLDEADHTVGFLLQLSNFCKEWQFHLPKLLHDVQVPTRQLTQQRISSASVSHPVFLSLKVNLCYLCQTCTYLLHSKKMLHHYLQVSVLKVILLLVEMGLYVLYVLVVLGMFRLKTEKHYPLDHCLGHSGPQTPRLKRQQAEGRREERKPSRRLFWLCSAVC